MTQPKDLLADAKSLCDSVFTEPRRRSVMSRAYYAAYHAMRAHPCTKGFSKYLKEQRESAASRKSKYKGVHSCLIDFLATSPEIHVVHAADQLKELYERRKWADYELTKYISRDIALDSLGLAEELIEGTLAEYDPSQDRQVS